MWKIPEYILAKAVLIENHRLVLSHYSKHCLFKDELLIMLLLGKGRIQGDHGGGRSVQGTDDTGLGGLGRGQD